LGIAVILTLAITGAIYYHYNAVDESECRQDKESTLPPPEPTPDFIAISLTNFFIAVGIVAIVLCLKRVIESKIKDFRESFGL
jgi:hypothetical protein